MWLSGLNIQRGCSCRAGCNCNASLTLSPRNSTCCRYPPPKKRLLFYYLLQFCVLRGFSNVAPLPFLFGHSHALAVRCYPVLNSSGSSAWKLKHPRWHLLGGDLKSQCSWDARTAGPVSPHIVSGLLSVWPPHVPFIRSLGS